MQMAGECGEGETGWMRGWWMKRRVADGCGCERNGGPKKEVQKNWWEGEHGVESRENMTAGAWEKDNGILWG